MQHTRKAKIGKQFGGTWYPNLFSAIVNRRLKSVHEKEIRVDANVLDTIMKRAKEVEIRYKRRYKNSGVAQG